MLLCTSARKQTPTDMVVNIGDFEVWSTTEQADLRITVIKAAEAAAAGVVAVPNATGVAGHTRISSSALSFIILAKIGRIYWRRPRRHRRRRTLWLVRCSMLPYQ